MKDFPRIYGFNKSSEIGNDDFAPSIFLGGCNLRCPYCMNSNLVNFKSSGDIDIEEVGEYVKKEKSEWVIISGGEPTCNGLLVLTNLLNKIKSWNCKIAMATNGTDSNKIDYLLPYLNYVAIDIKSSSPSDYASINISDDKSPLEHVLKSKKMFKNNKNIRDDFDYEVRTTLFPPFIKGDIDGFLKIIDSDEKWVLQQFRHAKKMINDDSRKIEPYDEETVKRFIEKVSKHIKNVQLRYV